MPRTRSDERKSENPAESDQSESPAETEICCEPEKDAEDKAAYNPGETDMPVIETSRTEDDANKRIPLSDAIDNLFSEPPQMNQMADKINSSLDEMGKQLLRFSSDFGKKLSDMADDMMNGSKKDDD